MLVDWNALRDLYVARFGQPYGCDAVTAPYDPAPEGESEDDAHLDFMMSEEEPPRFFLLDFWNPEQEGSPITYATFGAVHGGVGDELFLTAVTPYQTFEMAVKDLASVAPRHLAPLTIVPCTLRLSAFDAMIVVPAEGPSTLGEVDGRVRRLLRLVPITRAERLLAVREPERLLELLRASGALVADPLRTCVVAPEQDGGRRANAARLLENARRSERLISESDRKMREMDVPDVLLRANEPLLVKARATLAFFEGRAAAILPEPDAPERSGPEAEGDRMSALLVEVLAGSVEPYSGLVPRRVAEVLRVFAWALLSTHPVLYPILYEASTGAGRLPANEDPEGVFYAEHVEEQVRSLLKVIETASARRLAASGREAVKRAVSILVEHGPLSKLLAWNTIVVSLCVQAADLGAAQGPAVEQALREACTVAMGTDFEPRTSAGPARVRLARIASDVSKEFLRTYMRVTRRRLRERSTAG
jgi:hypothetical protein